MSRVVWVLVAGMALAVSSSAVDAVPVQPVPPAAPAGGQKPAPPAEKPKPGSAEAIIEALRRPADFDAANINDIPLQELIQKLSKQHGIAFVIQDELFKAEQVADISDKKPNLAAAGLKNLTLHQFLTVTLDSMNATFLVKSGRIEIVPPYAAIKATGADLREIEEGQPWRPMFPLISIIIKDRPLKEVVNSLADEYDLSIVISPKVGKALDESVSARLLNVPADAILDRLVMAADVRVIRRGNTFLITTPEHAKQLTAEQVELERSLVELRRLRGEVPFWFVPNLPGLGMP